MVQTQENLIHIFDTDLSDMFKDAYGFRPRGMYKDWWTQDELKAEYDHLSKVCNDAMDHERKAEREALKGFKALINKTIEYGAVDRLTALKWLVQGENLEWNQTDLGYFFWNHGLSYRLQIMWVKKLFKKS